MQIQMVCIYVKKINSIIINQETLSVFSNVLTT